MPDGLCAVRLHGARTTCRDKHILLLDTNHRHFDMRKLIVGMSRATHGQYVHVATPADEQQLLAACGVQTVVALRAEIRDDVDNGVPPSEYAANEDHWGVY